MMTSGSGPVRDPVPMMPADLDDQKRVLRRAMRQTLDAMSGDDRHSGSVAACARLGSLEAFRHASTVMIYLPLAAEVDTTSLALRAFQAGITVCAPRVNWSRRDMDAVEISSIDDRIFEADDHGVRSPVGGRPVVPTQIDLVVVPGLAFDVQGHRLGRGGGFYDRFLTRLRRGAVTAGLAFDGQIVDHVPAGPLDAAVDWVVTDRRLCATRPSASPS